MKDFNEFLDLSSEKFEQSVKEVIASSIGKGQHFNLEDLTSLIIAISSELTVERLRLYHEWLQS